MGPSALCSETMAKTAWLICTDLDASLLDAAYEWAGAEVALKAVRALGVPLVLNSSKTFAEMAPFAAALDPLAPVIAENGTAIGYPQCWGSGAADAKVDSYGVEYCGMKRTELLRIAHELRERKGYRFRGFSEMEAEALTETLGLDAKQARAALERYGSEPIDWLDSVEMLEEFSDSLAGEGITLVRGGRFEHLMPAHQSKGTALMDVLQRYRSRQPELQWNVLAIGDSPNDCSMLEIADQALVIPNPKRGTLKLKRPDYEVAPAPGPEGWGVAVLNFLSTQVSSTTNYYKRHE